jgi:hypothetical protein
MAAAHHHVFRCPLYSQRQHPKQGLAAASVAEAQPAAGCMLQHAYVTWLNKAAQ